MEYSAVDSVGTIDIVNLANVSHKEHDGHVRNLNDTYNSTLGFQKVFAINLPARTDKRDALVLSSKVTGFTVDIVPGVVSGTILEKTLPRKYIYQ